MFSMTQGYHPQEIDQTYNQLSSRRNSQNNTIHTYDLKNSQPSIHPAAIGMLDCRNLDNRGNGRDSKVGSIAFAFEKVSPIDGEPNDNLTHQYQRDDDFRSVDKAFAEVTHSRAP